MDSALKIVEVYRLANSLLREFELDDWTFDLSNEKSFVGHCYHEPRKLIVYSKHFIGKTSMSEIEDTIRHEIAHALVGAGHGHNEVWRAKCIEVGARPERCTEVAKSTAKPNYVIECEKCGKRWTRHRLKKLYIDGTGHSLCCHAPMKVYRYRR